MKTYCSNDAIEETVCICEPPGRRCGWGELDNVEQEVQEGEHHHHSDDLLEQVAHSYAQGGALLANRSDQCRARGADICRNESG